MTHACRAVALLAGCLAATALAHAQEAPKDKTLPPVPVEEKRPAPEPVIEPEQPRSTGPISWGSGDITSFGQLVGPYGQPEWTTQRPFAATRSYVLPEGTMSLEQWYRPRWKRDGTREDRVLEEFAVGLPCRFQLDIYARWHIEPDDDNHYNAAWEGTMIEVRWALADWDVIPLNPTLYAEWVQRGNKDGEPDKYELKLLLSEQFLKGKLFWAGNFILEKEVGGEKENELAYAQSIATPIIEGKLMAGVEMWYRAQNVHGARGEWNNEFLAGPTLQWRPTNRTFLTVTGFWGCNNDSPWFEAYFIAGFQFGKRAGPAENYRGPNPAALGS